MTEIGPAIVEPTTANIRTWLIGRIAHYLDEQPEAIERDVPLLEHGLDSVYAFTLCGEIEDALSVNVEPALIWNAESLTELADHIAKLAAATS